MPQYKKGVTVGGYTGKSHNIIRLFMDGLIAHVHMPVSDEEADGMYPMMVGPAEGTTLSLVTWQGSQQILGLADSIEKAEILYPGSVVGQGRSDLTMAWAPAPNQAKR